jgi:glycosyltransferase involved in cell wall biosynthesis
MNQTFDPKVSVVLPVHNGMPYLKLAVASILSQSFSAFELIVVDDGSTDGSSEYLASIEDPRVRVIRKVSGGVAATLNFGIGQARTEYIARMDADDIAYPQRLQLQYERMKGGGVLVGALADVIDESGNLTGEELNPLSDTAIRWSLLFRSSFVHPSVMFCRHAFEATGGYDPGFEVAQDFDLWTRMSRFGALSNLEERLISYRRHATNLSATRTLQQNYNASAIASCYAHSLFPEVVQEDWFAIHRFLIGGELLDEAKIVRLSRVFSQVRKTFLETHSFDCQELRDLVLEYQRKLRWRCVESAELRRLSRWSLLRCVRNFDPESLSLAGFAKRFSRSILGRG